MNQFKKARLSLAILRLSLTLRQQETERRRAELKETTKEWEDQVDGE